MTLGDLDQRGVLDDGSDRPVLGGRCPLAPGREPLGHRSRGCVELGDSRQAFPGRLRVAFVGGALEPSALLDRPLVAAARPQAALQLVGQRQQVDDVFGRVAELLLGQRPGVPARVAGGLAEAYVEDRRQQVAVARLRALAGESGGDLGVEDVRDLGAPGPTQDRDVLAPGVQDDFDRRVGQQRGQWSEVDRLVEAVDHDRPDARRAGARVLDRDLGQAQQRPVATLGHELGVDPEPPAGRGQAPRPRRRRLIQPGARGRGCSLLAPYRCARLAVSPGDRAGGRGNTDPDGRI